jgi:hypothetical protein
MTFAVRLFFRFMGALLMLAMLSACEVDPTVDQTALPLVTAGEPYRASLSASGGVQPYRCSVADGQLPQGLKLDAATDLIEGTATQLGRL